jgi:cytochrome oxidase Cu insertion factor (SCO1/SenC/PrrC family)
MKAIRWVLVLMAAVFLAPALDAADEAAPEKTGVPIGQRAPPFNLRDQTGNEVSLDSLLKKGPVALVFHRSADW